MIAVLTDVTAQVLARRELERVNRELEEFSYVASHDLQEPLRMVNIYTHLMLKHIGGQDETMSRYAAFVEQGVHRMETLLGDLLTYARAGQAEDLTVGSADLEVSLTEALAVLSSRVEESGAVITTGPLPKVRGDTKQMAHVFQNILGNSLKYRRSEATLAIEVWAEQCGDQWIVSVRDNGIGFDPKYSERIFGLFKRLHREEYPGTGLGLAICQRIVARYGGRIWADGRLGAGATFRFSLLGVAGDQSASNSAG
jgi:light-regulated signal transduction histidine kinase (bacteriophytochrome)